MTTVESIGSSGKSTLKYTTSQPRRWQ